MKKALSIAVALAFVTGIAVVASAQTSTSTPSTPPAMEKKAEPKSDKPAEKAQTPATKMASGAVKSAAADSVVVSGKEKGKDKEWTFAVDATTKVKKAGKDVPVAELKEGDKVHVRYTETGGKATATAVTVSSATTAKKAANPCAAKTDATKTEKKQ